jgi:hypothetical protein
VGLCFFNMARISKRQQRLQSQNLMIANLAGAQFGAIHFTTSNADLVTDFKKHFNLQDHNVGRKETYGGGTALYEGHFWKDESIYVGVDVANKKYIIRVLGGATFKYIASMCVYTDIHDTLCALNLTLVEFIYVVPSGRYQDVSELILTFNTLKANTQSSSIYINYTKDHVLQIGKKGQVRACHIRGLTVTNSRFSKFVCEVSLGGAYARNFLASATTMSSTVDGYCGKALLTVLKDLPVHELIETIRAGVTSQSPVGSVYIPTRVASTKIPKELKPVSAACTTVLNKMYAPMYTKDVQDILIQKFFERMSKERELISDYDGFVQRIVAALSKKEATPP